MDLHEPVLNGYMSSELPQKHKPCNLLMQSSPDTILKADNTQITVSLIIIVFKARLILIRKIGIIVLHLNVTHIFAVCFNIPFSLEVYSIFMSVFSAMK